MRLRRLLGMLAFGAAVLSAGCCCCHDQCCKRPFWRLRECYWRHHGGGCGSSCGSPCCSPCYEPCCAPTTCCSAPDQMAMVPPAVSPLLPPGPPLAPLTPLAPH